VNMVTRDGKIDAEDLGSVFKQLGYQTKRVAPFKITDLIHPLFYFSSLRYTT
jgi:hypothetical protein